MSTCMLHECMQYDLTQLNGIGEFPECEKAHAQDQPVKQEHTDIQMGLPKCNDLSVPPLFFTSISVLTCGGSIPSIHAPIILLDLLNTCLLWHHPSSEEIGVGNITNNFAAQTACM